MAAGINPFALQMQQLQRRQAIADMMQQQSQQPLDTQFTGGQYSAAVRRSPFEGLSKIAQAASGAMIQNSTDAKYQQIADAWSKAQNDSIGAQPSTPSAPPMPPQSAAPTPAPDAAPNMPPESIRAPGFMPPPMPPQQASGPPPSPAGMPQAAGPAPSQAPVQTFTDALRHAQQMSNLGVGDEVVKAYLAEHASTPEMKQVAALYGQDTPQYRSALERIVNPAVATQPNAPLARFNPVTGKYETAYAAPNLEKGINPIVENGQITGETTLPGASDVASTMAEAQARGKSMGDITNVTTGSGRVVPMLGRDALGKPTTLGSIGRGPQQAPQQSPKAAPMPGQAPGDKDIWADMPKMPAPTGIGQTTADKQYGEELGKRRNELATQLGQEASTAQVMQRYIDRAQESLPNASVGPFSNYLNGAKSALVQLGIPETFFSNMPSEGQKLNKDFVNMAASAIKSMPAFQNSPVRQAEFMLLMKEANPSTTMARRAVTDLLEYAKQDSGQLIQKNNLYTQFNQKGGDPNSFEAWYQKHFPTGGIPKPAAPGAGKTLVYDPASGTFK